MIRLHELTLFFSCVQWRLEKESIQAEIALLFEERNSLRKHMDAETPYMVLSDGIPRRQDSLESLVPEFEWDVFLKGTASMNNIPGS